MTPHGAAIIWVEDERDVPIELAHPETLLRHGKTHIRDDTARVKTPSEPFPAN